MATKTYDPAKFHLSIGGVPISGYAPDTFISAERAENGFTTQVGASGEVTRTRNNNRTGTVTVTLMASSLSNDVLNAYAQLDELSSTGIFVLSGFEFNGTSSLLAENAWVEKLPQTQRAKELGQVEWVIACADLAINTGGLVI